MTRDFAGIREKLARALNNIVYLDGKIKEFVDSGEYPVVSYEDKTTLLKAAEYYQKRVVPLAFSVVAGEIIHHLRSCLDHIAWQFSRDWYRADPKTQTIIEFPVFKSVPLNQARTRFLAKIKGISNPAALVFIERLQPYYYPKDIDSPLQIIHEMDVADKHRGLVLCVSSGHIPISPELFNRFARYHLGEPGSEPVDIGAEFKRNPYIYPNVAFQKFGRRSPEAVIQGLIELHGFVERVVNRFEQFSVLEDHIPDWDDSISLIPFLWPDARKAEQLIAPSFYVSVRID